MPRFRVCFPLPFLALSQGQCHCAFHKDINTQDHDIQGDTCACLTYTGQRKLVPAKHKGHATVSSKLLAVGLQVALGLGKAGAHAKGRKGMISPTKRPHASKDGAS
eukprot:1141535-Pelagomonas_calceolata.AAC.6